MNSEIQKAPTTISSRMGKKRYKDRSHERSLLKFNHLNVVQQTPDPSLTK